MVEEDDLDENGDARKRKCSRGEYGTEDERWAGRISREGVMEDLAKGCPCGCTDLLNVGEVLEARAEMERNDSEGKRTFTRTYLDDNPAPAKSGGYNFHPVTDSHRVLCYRGWEVRCARALELERARDEPCRQRRREDEPSPPHPSEERAQHGCKHQKERNLNL